MVGKEVGDSLVTGVDGTGFAEAEADDEGERIAFDFGIDGEGWSGAEVAGFNEIRADGGDSFFGWIWHGKAEGRSAARQKYRCDSWEGRQMASARGIGMTECAYNARVKTVKKSGATQVIKGTREERRPVESVSAALWRPPDGGPARRRR